MVCGKDTVSSEYLVVLCTCPDDATATRISRDLVESRLAACVNRVPGVRSVYRWEGNLEDQSEVLLLIKTRLACYAELEVRLGTLHPYEVPEIIALPVVAGSESYLGWLTRETSSS